MDGDPTRGWIGTPTRLPPSVGDGSSPLPPPSGAQLHLARHSARLMDGLPTRPPSLSLPPALTELHWGVGEGQEGRPASAHSIIQPKHILIQDLLCAGTQY